MHTVIVIFLVLFAIISVMDRERNMYLSIFPLYILVKILQKLRGALLIIALMITMSLFRFNLSLMFYYLNLNANRKSRQIVTEKFLKNHFILSHNLQKLPVEPTILVCNYCYDRLENLVYLLMPANCTLISARCYQDVCGIVDNYITKKEKTKTFDFIQKQVDIKMKAGNSIFVYVSSYKENTYGHVGILRSGMFRIAQKLGVTITPVAIDHIYSDTNFHIPYQNFRIKVGKPQLVTNIEQCMKGTHDFFKQQLKYFTKNKFRGIEHV